MIYTAWKSKWNFYITHLVNNIAIMLYNLYKQSQISLISLPIDN